MMLEIISGKVSIVVIEYAHGENVGKTGVMSYAKEDPVELSKFYMDICKSLGIDVSLVDLANKKEITIPMEKDGRESDSEHRVLREELADLSHEIWSHWMKYLFSRCEKLNSGMLIPWPEALRWAKQMRTSYNELSNREKESDREQADKIIERIYDIVESHKKEIEDDLH